MTYAVLDTTAATPVVAYSARDSAKRRVVLFTAGP